MRLTIRNYIQAIMNNDLAFVRRYLRHCPHDLSKINPFSFNHKQPEFYKASAFYIACALGRTGVVNLLLNYGIDIHQGFRPSRSRFFASSRDVNVSPLHAAAKNGHYAIVFALLQNGARVNQRLQAGDTPLLYACDGGHTDVAELLLQNGAAVGASRLDGETALHVAAKKGDFDMVKLLLCHGAGLSATGYILRSPIDEAVDAGHEKIAKHMRRVRDDSTFHPLGYVKV